MVKPKPSQTKERLLELMAEKDRIERKIEEYGAKLKANGNVGMSEPLVDGEGFPRNDIDVREVRLARHQIRCMHEDRNALMAQIESLLHLFHAEQKKLATLENQMSEMQFRNDADFNTDNDDSRPVADNDSIARELDSPLRVLVVVNLVSEGSPAEEAGLCVGDEILQFGTINSRNFTNDVNQIGSVVRHMLNQRVALKVHRNQQILDMILVPKEWSGRGYLGCNIMLPSPTVVDR